MDRTTVPRISSPADALALLRRQLGEDGLDLVSVVSLDRLAPALAAGIREAGGFRAGERDLRVVVIGNRGGRFWSHLPPPARSADHPLDAFTTGRVRAAFAGLGDGGHCVLVYPGECGFSLLQLGRACGWGVPSWLGVYIHPEFGTWFAFRAVAVTRMSLPDSVLEDPLDACLHCTTRDCLAACPVDAPGPPGRFALDACAAWRLAPLSPCAARCLARDACPVGAAYRYPQGLLAHVYGRSLASLRRYRDQRDDDQL